MKKLKLPLLITIIMAFVIVENTQAQSRCFFYDNAGNRVTRSINCTGLDDEDKDVFFRVIKPSEEIEEEILDAPDMVVFPNPCSAYFNVKMEGVPSDTPIYVYDSAGKQVKIGSVGQRRVEVSDLKFGTYIVVVSYEGKVYTRKLVVK